MYKLTITIDADFNDVLDILKKQSSSEETFNNSEIRLEDDDGNVLLSIPKGEKAEAVCDKNLLGVIFNSFTEQSTTATEEEYWC